MRARVAEHMDEIVQVIVRDTGKPPLDALAGDVMVTLEQLRFYEREGSRILTQREVGKPGFLFSRCHFYESFEPHGLVFILAPYNYPFQLSVIPMVTALIAGNAVLLKCSEKTPRVAELIERLCADEDLPAGLVQVVCDPPEQAGELFAAQPDFVFFTGSTRAGHAIAERAARNLIPAVLELGGKDPCLVFADCDLERTIEGVAYGSFSNAGQVCVGIKRLYIEQSIYEEFLRRLIERVGKLRIGSSANDDLGAFPDGVQRRELLAQVEEALRDGAVLHWPPREQLTGETPILLSDVSQGSRLLAEENLGPVLCIGKFRSLSEAVELANEGFFALSASIWTRDTSRALAVAAELNVGNCAVNDVIRSIANPQASFGGNGKSGYGRYHGPQGLYAFSRIKTVMVASDREKRPMHWFPFTQKTFDALRRLMHLRHGGTGVWARILGLLPALLCALCVLPIQAQSDAATLKISIRIPAQSRGEVAYLVFSSPSGFPNDKTKAIRGGFVQPLAGQDELVIDVKPPLPPGRYAVSAYQDLNGNGRLDTGWLGIPTEPVGVSNNPHLHFGPPRFEQCVFTLAKGDQTIRIRLVH
jgi:acyl-CoA reductase-like NAD-dependent aldehyde dehydrogenase/uncharacterized protein (DUF2141 family)